MRYLSQRPLSIALDVGANRGQYARELRRGGFAGRIISFEPLPGPFAVLESAARQDPGWEARQVAIGAESGAATFHVAGNVDSSSLLPMLPRHVEGAPLSAVSATVSVPVVRLDELLPELIEPEDRLLLKMDVQGYEQQVLEGAGTAVEQVEAIECELSFVALYEGQTLAPTMFELLSDLGFEIAWLEPGFTDEATEQLLQADGLFLRRRRNTTSGPR